MNLRIGTLFVIIILLPILFFINGDWTPSQNNIHVDNLVNSSQFNYAFPAVKSHSEKVATTQLAQHHSKLSNTVDPSVFISVWDTTRTSDDSSSSMDIHLPLVENGTYNFTVDWGDGNSSQITGWLQTNTTHSYQVEGNYTIQITGTLNGWEFNDGGDKLKILEISQWGNLQLGNFGGYFYGCANLVITASDIPNLNGTTNLQNAFTGCFSLGNIGDFNSWNVSQVTDMGGLFQGDITFNQSLRSWNVSSVTDMSWMFGGYYYFGFIKHPIFNQPLDQWDVSRVTDMSGMFYSSSFNQSLDIWDVSRVTDMSRMFEASSFNQSLNQWDVSSVTDMSRMFYSSSFNQPLNEWDVSQVKLMATMFNNSSFTTANYDALLIAWAKLTLQTSVRFDVGTTQYSQNAADARSTIINNFGWQIHDGGLIGSEVSESTSSTSTNSSSDSTSNSKAGLFMIWSEIALGLMVILRIVDYRRSKLA